MITKRFIHKTLFVLFASTSWAHAQATSVAIRAGEHPTYSRLVIPTANDLAWELRTSGREAMLIIPDAETTFTTDRVFDRIPRTRLLDVDAEVVANETQLKMRLGCDCSVTANIDGRSIILDINDPDAKSGESDAKEAASNNEETPQRPQPRPEQTATAEAEQADEQAEQRSFDLAQQLISQLSMAAEQGIIELNDDVDEPTEVAEQNEVTGETMALAPEEIVEPEPLLEPVEEPLDGLDAVAERIEQELAALEGLAELDPSVRITMPEEFVVPDRTDGMVSKPKELEKEPEVEVMDTCVDGELLDVAYWADERPYSVQVVKLQSLVFGEFDEPDPDAVLRLARFYLYFGLGTEAKSILSDLDVDEFQTELLIELAEIVEGKPHVPGGILDQAAGCSGPVALWRTAAIDEGESQPVSDYSEVIDIFSEYPIYVRRIIGPRLIQSFLTRRQHTAASLVFAIVERAAGYHGDPHELRRADLKHLDGDHEEAENIYWRLVHRNSLVSAEAAKSLVDSMQGRGAQVPNNVISVLEALAFELRGSTQGTELLLAAIVAKAGSKRVPDAVKIALIESQANPDQADAYFGAINSILDDVTVTDMGAYDYADFIYENMDLVTGDKLTDQNKVDIANEFLAIGLPNTTIDILQTLTDPDHPGALQLAAAASLKLRDLNQVIKLWQENPSQTGLTQLAARSHSALGQHQQALAISNEDTDATQSPRLAWRAGAWNAAVEADELPLQMLSQFMIQRSSPAPHANDADLTTQEDAIAVSIPAEEKVTLKYAEDVRQQSSVIREFLGSVISDM